MRHLFSVPPAEDSVSPTDTHCLRPGVTRAVHQSGAGTCARLDPLANSTKDAKANARGRGTETKTHTSARYTNCRWRRRLFSCSFLLRENPPRMYSFPPTFRCESHHRCSYPNINCRNRSVHSAYN